MRFPSLMPLSLEAVEKIGGMARPGGRSGSARAVSREQLAVEVTVHLVGACTGCGQEMKAKASGRQRDAEDLLFGLICGWCGQRVAPSTPTYRPRTLDDLLERA